MDQANREKSKLFLAGLTSISFDEPRRVMTWTGSSGWNPATDAIDRRRVSAVFDPHLM
jgi:hypothetical protein